MNRIFKQRGQGYNDTPISIVAKINGQNVFTGEVLTLNEPLPDLPQPEINFGVDMFAWPQDAMFAGTLELEIQVTSNSGVLLITDTLAQRQPVIAPTWYDTIYQINQSGVPHFDPLSNVRINDVEQTQLADPNLTGQMYWQVSAGSTFKATVNVNLFKPMHVTPIERPSVAVEFPINKEIFDSWPGTIQNWSGIAPYTWSVTPTLPAGLNLDPNDGIYGSPTTVTPAADYNFTVVDYLGASESFPLKIAIVA